MGSCQAVKKNNNFAKLDIPTIEGQLQFANTVSYQEHERNCPPFHLCYIPQLKKAFPLKSLEYNVSIMPGLQVVNIIQEYENDLDKIMEVEYMFAIDDEAAFSKMEVQIGDQILYGVIKEKETAKEEYEQGVKEGKTMVYSEQIAQTPDIMKVKLGNLLPQARLIIKFEYVRPLEVCVNKFWRVVLPYTIIPRYGQAQNQQKFHGSIQAKLESIVTLNTVQQHKWNITLDIDLPVPITFQKCPTHSLIQMNAKEGEQKSQKFILDPADPTNLQPNKDFIFLFSNEDITKPISSLTHQVFDNLSHQKYCAVVSFIPSFNNLTIEDAYTGYLEENQLISDDFDYPQKGQYAFLIDRSGSMGGNRILKATQALKLFIQSLPIDSYFNVTSFGSSYQCLFKEFKKLDEQSKQDAITGIEQFSADMGGTEILEALENIYQKKRCAEYPLNIFLLTDGAVSDPDSVIELVQSYRKSDIRVYTMGVGNGCSRYLVEKLAVCGNGTFEFIDDDENLNEKVISQLQDSITPYLQKFQVKISNQNALNTLIPNPQQMICLRKNRPFTLYALFDKSLGAYPELSIEITCSEGISNTKFEYKASFKVEQSQCSDFQHKIATAKIITAIQNAYKYEKLTVNDLLVSNRKEIKLSDLIQLSLQYQILCTETAFICDAIHKIDDQQQQYIRSLEKVFVSQRPIEAIQKKQTNRKLYKSQLRQQKAKQQSHKAKKTRINLECRKKEVDSDQDQIQKECFQHLEGQYIQQEQQEKIQSDQDMNEQDFQNKDQDNLIFNYQNIVALQQLNGSFRLDQLQLESMGISKECYDMKPLSIDSNEAWNTLIAMVWLEYKCNEDQGSWLLVFKKARNYLQQLNIKYHITKVEVKKVMGI